MEPLRRGRKDRIDPSRSTRRQARRLVAVAIIVALVLAGCSKAPDNATPAVAPKLSELDAAQFERRLADEPGALVINVHVPYEGEIEGTEKFIPFDQIVGHADLPADRNAALLLYCRSGSMSATAGEALIAAGYTNVAHLRGGMQAWQAGGRPLRSSP